MEQGQKAEPREHPPPTSPSRWLYVSFLPTHRSLHLSYGAENSSESFDLRREIGIAMSPGTPDARSHTF